MQNLADVARNSLLPHDCGFGVDIRTLTAVRAIAELLTGFGISFQRLLSGRGHHFVWSIRKDFEVFDLLAKLAVCLNRWRP